jgi:hypothetical protein
MKQGTLNYYDKDKYREMILDAAETVLKFLGFDRTVYGMPMKNRKRKWYDETQNERTKGIHESNSDRIYINDRDMKSCLTVFLMFNAF